MCPYSHWENPVLITGDPVLIIGILFPVFHYRAVSLLAPCSIPCTGLQYKTVCLVTQLRHILFIYFHSLL